MLEGCVGRLPIFVKLYATYLAGEKRKEDDAVDLLTPLDKGQVIIVCV